MLLQNCLLKTQSVTSLIILIRLHRNWGIPTLDGAEENKKVQKATIAVDENDDNAVEKGFISDENLILVSVFKMLLKCA